MRTFALFALAFSAATAAATNPASVPEAVKQLNGYWKPESVLYEGQEQLPDAKSKELLTLVIKDGDYRMYYASDPAKDLHVRLFTAELRLDPTSKTCEINVKDGNKKGDARHGIYEMTGTQLKICYGPANQARPTKFEAPKGSGYFCETWVAEKKK